ncbi:MAG: phage major capsid protein [Planctomycetes bacterium]|nr:phage major capsid protein [Planctomycetota bacterium]
MPPVTLEQIEKGLDQIKTNMATKKEVIDLIDKKIDEDKEKQQAETTKAIDEAKTTIDEVKKANDALASQIKTLKATRFAAIKTPDGMYKGMWGDLETARNFGLYVLASVGGEAVSKAATEQLKNKGIELKAISSGSNALGGVLAPTEFIPSLIMMLAKYGVFRANVLEYPMAGESATAPRLSSGLTVYCPGEGVAPDTSDPGFSSVGLQAKKWMTLTAIDSEVDEDSAIAIGELVGYLIAHAFAKKEDEVGFLGDGTSTYFGHTGIVGALLAVDATIGNIKSLVVADGNLYSEITLANFETLLGTLPDEADDGDAKFHCHRKFFYTVMVKLALAAGGANATEIIQGRGVREKSFLSYPVEFTNAMYKAEADSQICTIFGNLRMGAYLGDRRKITIDRSSERYFDTDQIGIRGTERVAPTVHGVGDTTDAGPICGLITAAS